MAMEGMGSAGTQPILVPVQTPSPKVHISSSAKWAMSIPPGRWLWDELR